jgi:hypothetical protein
MMQTAARVYFKLLDALSLMKGAEGAGTQVRAFARRWRQAAKHRGTRPQQLLVKTGNCSRDPVSRAYVVAPALDGRIQIVGGAAGDAAHVAGAYVVAPSPDSRMHVDARAQPAADGGQGGAANGVAGP